ncbi:hypothetical protein CK203_065618 [Vitis vinifera]|uniref:Uncharacterized protein n=1 Tax=Vitis vinifera TaxID=29760 RepID=A0A438FXI2_VITVI|nr:hypothetical protein CK203_065618 [Vitis vinifera]
MMIKGQQFPSLMPEAHVIEEITFVIWKSLNQELLHVEKNLDGMDRQRVSFSSSSSSSSIGPSEYEDFLSFWDEDEDAKHNFIGHLYAALNRKWIRTFRINDLREEILHWVFCTLLKSQGWFM